eukprot:CAMPEP_0182462046 /NCGR_PEP_ID=MMETSP1319-20130603/6442_1 /TAXON_ID=172717 /ORGANISM="Bolidomonas pacifica, Strain RCC208" /LENGTH=177 /DNA_ID=CAMNT_0024661419 /DNA_START=78 /DNA_END=611 /DNA_ORIENTATION=-
MALKGVEVVESLRTRPLFAPPIPHFFVPVPVHDVLVPCGELRNEELGSLDAVNDLADAMSEPSCHDHPPRPLPPLWPELSPHRRHALTGDVVPGPRVELVFFPVHPDGDGLHGSILSPQHDAVSHKGSLKPRQVLIAGRRRRYAVGEPVTDYAILEGRGELRPPPNLLNVQVADVHV